MPQVPEIPLSQQALTRSEVIAWEALSFFAADVERQRAVLGPALDWFVDDDPRRPHANFLLAMATVYHQYSVSLGDVAPAVEPGLLELRQRFSDLLWTRDWSGWSADALAEEASWGDTRRLARACLQALGLHENLPRPPVEFERLIEVEPVEWCRKQRQEARAARGKHRSWR